jgi:hypothetical protein
MAKKIDNNIDNVLAELDKHPALLDRCQEFYLHRVVNKSTYQELADTFGVSLCTAYKYVQAYQRVAGEHVDTPCVREVIAFCEHEMYLLIKKRDGEKDKDDNVIEPGVKSVRDDLALTQQIRNYQVMINELAGLTRKAPLAQMNFVKKAVDDLVEIINRHIPDEATRRRIGEELYARGQYRAGGGNPSS